MTRAFLALIAAVVLFGTAAPALAQQEGEVRETTTFEAVDPSQSRHKEDLSGMPFMVASYMIIWGGLFLYLVALQKRNTKVQAEIADLRRAIESHDAARGR